MKKLVLIVASLFALSCNNQTKDKQTVTERDNKTNSSGAIQKMENSMTRMMTNMRNMQPSGNPDLDFASMMRYHHIGAVEMAQAELSEGTDSTIRAMAEQIIRDQQSEIEAFDEYLAGNPERKGRSKLGQVMLDSMKSDHAMPDPGGNVDAAFVHMMIPHHEDGISMAKEYLKEGKNDRLLKIANNIIGSQRREIDEFRAWLATYQGPAPDHHDTH